MHQTEGSLNRALVLNAFREIKDATDDIILKHGMDTYCEEYLPRSDELTVAIIIRAFEILGCNLQSCALGTKLTRIESPNQKLMNWIYNVLEKAGLIDIKGEIFRTSVPCPSDDVETLLEDLLDDRPGQSLELQIIGIIGSAYADAISGKTDAVKLLFNDQNRGLMSDFYAKSDLSGVVLDQLAMFLEKICKDGPLRILEVGAGTGGTTWRVLPVLKRIGISFTYTMTDIGSAFGAAAKEKLARYGGEFKVLDIEKEPELHGYHIVLGSNVFHATRDLKVSMGNVRKMLRPDGFVVLHELTRQMHWADLMSGLFPGWWAFDDGRSSTIQSAEDWGEVLKSVGFGYVDWTDGERPEAKVQALILGMAS